jgi:hypothetical protein
MTHLILDLETFALDDARHFIEEPTAPANYKDPEKIAAYIAQRKIELIDRCALDPDLCRIVAIGWDSPDACGGPTVDYADTEQEERALLVEAWDVIRGDGLSMGPSLVGFNLLAFDLPVLIRRSQYLGLRIPPLNLDKYRTPHVDLMERLSFNGKIKAHSLDFYCKRFGIEVADDVSGADVDALVKAGEWDRVLGHCRADVQKTRLLAERLGLLTQKAEAVAS